MICFKKLLDFEREKQEIKEKHYRERRLINNSLSGFDKIRYDKIQEMIYKITYKIEKDTGWEYTDRSFILPSDFTYSNGDIDFTINNVSSTDLGYLPKIDMNDREYAFLEQNSKLLKRLGKLENKRDFYLNKAREINPNMVFMTSTKSTKSKNLDALFMQRWLEEESNRFISKYHEDGIKRLIKILNLISDNSTDESYGYIMNMYISSEYKRDLLRWASTFSKRGNILLEKFNERLDKIARADSFPDSFMHDESEFILRYRK